MSFSSLLNIRKLRKEENVEDIQTPNQFGNKQISIFIRHWVIFQSVRPFLFYLLYISKTHHLCQSCKCFSKLYWFIYSLSSHNLFSTLLVAIIFGIKLSSFRVFMIHVLKIRKKVQGNLRIGTLFFL